MDANGDGLIDLEELSRAANSGGGEFFSSLAEAAPKRPSLAQHISGGAVQVSEVIEKSFKALQQGELGLPGL